MAEPPAFRLGVRLIAVVMRNQPDFEIDRTGAVALVAASVIFSPPPPISKEIQSKTIEATCLGTAPVPFG
jgi:hypothetical protein